MTFAATILTLYPEMFPGPLGISLAGRGLAEGVWALETVQIRDFATDKHRSVDDTPAGGGAGMVLRCDVLARAVDHAVATMRARIEATELATMRDQPLPPAGGRSGGGLAGSADGGGVGPSSGVASPSGVAGPSGVAAPSPNPLPAGEGAQVGYALGDREGAQVVPIIALTPRGRPITQARIRELAAGPGVILICGRFEGFDERIFAGRDVEEVSVGDIVLSGGEPAALMLLDACIRLLPGVMGAASSGHEESFENGLLEYPQYTRPPEWEGRAIPEVLRSGDHAKIAAWRQARAEADTRSRRPDLWERHVGARGRSASGARRRDEGQEGS